MMRKGQRPIMRAPSIAHMTSPIITSISYLFQPNYFLHCYYNLLHRLFVYTFSELKSFTTARSIANNSLPSWPIDPSEGGISIDKNICFLVRRATATKPVASVSVCRACSEQKRRYHQDAVP